MLFQKLLKIDQIFFSQAKFDRNRKKDVKVSYTIPLFFL